jgi:hypothetical protein
MHALITLAERKAVTMLSHEPDTLLSFDAKAADPIRFETHGEVL